MTATLLLAGPSLIIIDKAAMILVEGSCFEETIEHIQEVIKYFEKEFIIDDL